MKLYFILLLFTLSGCVLFYEPLEYYVEGYSPNNDSLRTNGFYYRPSDSIHLDAWPKAVAEMYFFQNGSFKDGTNVENIDSLELWMCEQENWFAHGSFGFYTVRNDTILVEFVFTDPMLTSRASRIEFKAVQTTDGLTIVELGGQPWTEAWLFSENDCVPDSIENWLVTHRKYRIDW
jgi:hypothetical protein